MDDKKFNRSIAIAKLVASIAVPVAIGISGFYVQHSISEYQSRQMITKEISIKLADRRLNLYDQIKGPLNQIYCYIEQIGDWDELSIKDIKNIRRDLNKIMYSNRAIWSPETFNLYLEYIDRAAFQVDFNGSESKIRAEVNDARLLASTQHNDFAWFLTGAIAENHMAVYRELNEALSDDLMLTETSRNTN